MKKARKEIRNKTTNLAMIKAQRLPQSFSRQFAPKRHSLRNGNTIGDQLTFALMVFTTFFIKALSHATQFRFKNKLLTVALEL